MHALKGLVVFLAVLIMVSFGLLIYGFVTRFSKKGSEIAEPEAAVKTVNPVSNSGDVRVTLPNGCVVEEMRPDGARLYLRLGPADQCAQILVLDSRTGAQLGVFVLGP